MTPQMKASPYSDNLQTKIDLVQLTQAELMEDFQGGDREISTLLSILDAYEFVLLRQRYTMATDEDDLQQMKEAVRDSGCFLVDLARSRPDLMTGWVHGVTPTNPALALANFLSRIILELSGLIWTYEQHFPERKEHYDAERRHHAKPIQEQDEAEGY